MIDVSWSLQCRMNADLPDYEKVSRAEKAALRRAKEAEYRFRVSKGYEKDTLWDRLKLRLFSNGGSL